MMNRSPAGSKLLVSAAFAVVCAFFVSCSIPNLEDPKCTAARSNVKKLYSQHFGGELKPSAKSLEQVKPYLTIDLYEKLSTSMNGNIDYFTQTDDYPKAFRLGECSVDEKNGSVVLQIVLFWRDDTRSDQREVYVTAKNIDENWLVNEVKSEK